MIVAKVLAAWFVISIVASVPFGRHLRRHHTMNDQPTVEIGGQVMTQAQFDAARYPLLAPPPPAILDETSQRPITTPGDTT